MKNRLYMDAPLSTNVAALFTLYAKDAGNWSGTPLVEGNVSLLGAKEDRGLLTQLKKAGLVTTFVDDRNTWLDFTAKGIERACDEDIFIEKCSWPSDGSLEHLYKRQEEILARHNAAWEAKQKAEAAAQQAEAEKAAKMQDIVVEPFNAITRVTVQFADGSTVDLKAIEVFEALTQFAAAKQNGGGK